MSSKHLLSALVNANKGILNQKLSLLEVMETKFGTDGMQKLFTRICPIVHASIGQHYRHSLDHVELAALVASTSSVNSNIDNINNSKHSDPLTLRYDLRVRGGTLEKDVNETRKRIHNVIDVFQNIEDVNVHSGDDLKSHTPVITEQSVNASFMLSSDIDDEMELESTIGRELGFCAHHAIHHLAMVKVIAIQTIGLKEGELPENFGKAPSTTRFEAKQ